MLFIKRDIQKFISEWRQNQNRSLKVINILLNIAGRLNIIQSKSMYKELKEFPDLEDRLVYSLYEQIDLRLPQLKDSYNNFEKQLDKMHKWQEMAKFRINDRQNRLSKTDDDYANKVSLLEQIIEDIDSIIDMFEAEVKLKARVIKEIQSKKVFDPMLFNFYLTIWMSEAYIDYNFINEKMEKVKYLQKLIWS